MIFGHKFDEIRKELKTVQEYADDVEITKQAAYDRIHAGKIDPINIGEHQFIRHPKINPDFCKLFKYVFGQLHTIKQTKELGFSFGTIQRKVWKKEMEKYKVGNAVFIRTKIS